MILLPTFSAANIENDVCEIDRKFHTGVCLYAQHLPGEIVVLAPQLRSSDRTMDFISVQLSDLPYRVELVKCDGNYRLDSSEISRVQKLASGSSMVYGIGFDTERFAYKAKVPVIPILEYTLRTQIHVALSGVSGITRRLVRSLKTVLRTFREIYRLRWAREIHCNGYPIFEQTRRIYPSCLMYLDSRMYENMVIEEHVLLERMHTFGTRPVRLIYSGRFDEIKGALDVVEVGLELKAMGLDFTLDLYGEGQQLSAMHANIQDRAADAYIRIHKPVPYPELVEISKQCDVFVCCHVQEDPSCTYLEALGSGLTVVGYGNRMWSAMSKKAKTGIVTPINNPKRLALSIAQLIKRPEKVREHSIRSRAFALEHCFEREFSKRMKALTRIYKERPSRKTSAYSS